MIHLYIGLFLAVSSDAVSSDDQRGDSEDERPNLARTLVFTTLPLLGLLAVCKNGNVDGTFRVMTSTWRQLYILIGRINHDGYNEFYSVLLVDYKKGFVPVAFGWLPDKTALAYHIFFLLIFTEFRKRSADITALYGSASLKLNHLMLDFEDSQHQALKRMFKRSGCFFHYTKVG